MEGLIGENDKWRNTLFLGQFTTKLPQGLKQIVILSKTLSGLGGNLSANLHCALEGQLRPFSVTFNTGNWTPGCRQESGSCQVINQMKQLIFVNRFSMNTHKLTNRSKSEKSRHLYEL